MTDPTSPATSNALGTGQPAPLSTHSVIGVRADRGWEGRYLHHSPSLTETGTLLHQLITLRYRQGERLYAAARDLIGDHPAGWDHLGAATKKDPQLKARRVPAPLGQCLCHEPDGAMRPALAAAAYQALRETEKPLGYRPAPTASRQGLTDGSPWLVRSGTEVPDTIEYLFLLTYEGLEVLARDGATPHTFAPAGTAPWTGSVDWEAIEARTAHVRNRTKSDLAAEAAAHALAGAARRLSTIPAHVDLVLHLVSESRRRAYSPVPGDPEAALAAAAGVHSADLPGHLLRLNRSDQIALLQTAAHQLDPVQHASPTTPNTHSHE